MDLVRIVDGQQDQSEKVEFHSYPSSPGTAHSRPETRLRETIFRTFTLLSNQHTHPATIECNPDPSLTNIQNNEGEREREVSHPID